MDKRQRDLWVRELTEVGAPGDIIERVSDGFYDDIPVTNGPLLNAGGALTMVFEDTLRSRLTGGETLVIIDQWRTYISMDGYDCVLRGIYEREEREAKEAGKEPQYEEKRYGSLLQALLSLLDYKWQSDSYSLPNQTPTLPVKKIILETFDK